MTAEQEAVQASIRRWAARAGTLATVREQEPGAHDGADVPWRRHWADLAALGVFSIAVPEHSGGAGGTTLDAAVALEQLADALAPGPVLPTVLAGLLLAGHAGRPAVKELLPAIAAGDLPVGVAFEPGTVTVIPSADGRLRVSGRAGPVLGAGSAPLLMLPAGDGLLLLPADHPGVRLTPRAPVDFSRPLADVELAGAVVPPDRLIPGVGPARVRDAAALLGAAEAAGLAAWCLRTATEYAKVRQQFGRPIGAFQAVKHLCAGMLCRAERAAALAWDAARAFDEAPAESALAVAAAAAVALDAAVDNAKDCVQVLGGIGFTWEHDAHLYLRRALALRQLLGDGAAWRDRVAGLVLDGARRAPGAGLTAAPAPGDSSSLGPDVRAIAALPEPDRRAALADAGLIAPEWPRPFGRAATPAEQLLIDDELAAAGVTRPDIAIAGWAVPTILRHGTEAQRERFAGPSLRGEIVWCQLFSEPEAGSDLASLRTRATRVGGGWRLSGQKVWTSLAAQADWGICLARTDPAAPKHRGLTYFLVEMRSPGIEIRPLREITGRSVFNEVYLDDVFVPDECVVGEPGAGWRLARGTLEHERVAIGRGPSLGDGVERLIRAGRPGGPGDGSQPGARTGPPAGIGARDRLGGLVADGLAVSLLDLRVALRRLDGDPQRAAAESAVAKLVGVGHRQAVAEAELLLAGPDGATADGAAAEAVHQFLLTRCLSIAGGTTQILLSVVAERVLGLPREEAR